MWIPSFGINVISKKILTHRFKVNPEAYKLVDIYSDPFRIDLLLSLTSGLDF